MGPPPLEKGGFDTKEEIVMKTNGLLVGIALLPLSYLSGCDNQKDDLLVDYQSHAVEARDEVGRFQNGEMSTTSMNHMDTLVGEHLKEMRSLRVSGGRRGHRGVTRPAYERRTLYR
jgi:hypothetical protein